MKSHYFAQGAFVMVICALVDPEPCESPAAGAGGFDANVPGRALGPGGGGGALELGAPAVPLTDGICVGFAQGAAVPVTGGIAAIGGGWFAMCTLCVGTAAFGSSSQEKREPKGKC